MKFTLSAVCFIAALAIVAATEDAGHFIPKAFYTLDPLGHKSDLHPINPHTAHYLRRLRRQVFSSASSSSSSSSDNGQTFFTNQQVLHHSPDNQNPDFSSRFGETSSSDSRPTVTGHIVQTSGVIGPNGQGQYQTNQGVIGADGKVHYQTQKGQFN